MYSSYIVAALTIFLVTEAKISPTTYHTGLEDYASHNEEFEHHEPAKYKYSYTVEDHKTGDCKTHQEERDGNIVKGEYTVAEPNGKLRIVKYTVDKHSGFQAVVSYIGGEHTNEEEEVETHHHYAKHETQAPKYFETSKQYEANKHASLSQHHVELPHHFQKLIKDIEVPKFEKKERHHKQHKPAYHEAIEEVKPVHKYVNPQFYHTTEGLQFFQ